MTENKTYSKADVDLIIDKVKNIKNAFLEGIDSNLKSIQNIKETFVTGAEKQIEKLQNLQPIESEEPEKEEWRQKPEQGEKCFCIYADGSVDIFCWAGDEVKTLFYKSGNCFPCALFSEEQVQQIAWQNQLNSLLTQYAIINNALASKEEKEDDSIPLYWAEEVCDKVSSIESSCGQTPLVVKFNNEDVALQAIKDVIKPFLAEHPEFVW